MQALELFDEHEGGQLRIGAQGDQVPLLPLPAAAIPNERHEVTPAELEHERRAGDVVAFLAEKAESPREWLRREPRETHPAIVEAVRVAHAGGFTYDDAVVRRCEESLEVPAGLLEQLGHEVYVAKGQLHDEEARAALEALKAEGYEPLDEARLEPGVRYLVRCGTLYVGRSVANYGGAFPVRAERAPGGHVGLKRKGGRVFVHVPTPAMIRRDGAGAADGGGV